MPIINLTLQGKQAIGDGTKIVCMNGDYQVRVNTDCEEFLNLPHKTVVVKTDKDYWESPISTGGADVDGTNVVYWYDDSLEQWETYYGAEGELSYYGYCPNCNCALGSWSAIKFSTACPHCGAQVVYDSGAITGWSGESRANLPALDNVKYVELGVCGRLTQGGDPVFSSMPAKFECVKSVLCGAVVLHKDPVLKSKYITSNGKYTASDEDADGYFEVDVNVADTYSEQRTVALAMSGGNQMITPSASDRNMTLVTVTKPASLTPDNIRKGVDIGGVVGSYEKVFTETEIFQDGEYTPPVGVDGFSRVIVSVGSGNFSKNMQIGQSFTYDYDTSVNITLDTSGVVKYENDGNVIIITAIGCGTCSVLLKDMDASGNVVHTIHYAIEVHAAEDLIKPMELSTPNDMRAYLEAGESVVGAVFKYTGPNVDGFVNGALYTITEEDGT